MRRLPILLLFLCALTGYAQNIRVTSATVGAGGLTNGGPFKQAGTTSAGRVLTDVAGNGLLTLEVPSSGTDATKIATNNGVGYRTTVREGFSTTGGETNQGTAPVHQAAPLLVLGSLNFPPTTNTTLTVNVATNAIAGYTTNANFTVTFTGTALDGARGEYRVWNTAATNIEVGWPVSWSEQTGAAITTITAISNSVTRILWRRESGSNYVSVSGKDQYMLTFSGSPSVGQVFKIHCLSCGPGGSMVVTNSDDSTGAGGGDALLVNATAVSDSASLTNITAAAGTVGVTWTIVGAADPDPDKINLALSEASGTVAGFVSANNQTFAGLKFFSSGISNTHYFGTGIITQRNDVYIGGQINAGALVLTNDYDYLWVPAGAMNPVAVNGPSTNTLSYAEGTAIEVFDFDDTIPETNCFTWTPPDNWDRSTFKAKFHWSATTGAGAVTWAIRVAAVSDDDPLGAAFSGSTGVQVSDTLITSNDEHITAATGAITVNGSPALGDMLLFQVERKPGDVSDTKTGDAKLIGVHIQYKISAQHSTAW